MKLSLIVFAALGLMGVLGCSSSTTGGPDGGPDADMGRGDGGELDAAMSDAGPVDGGNLDLGRDDAGPRDAGPPRPDAGMCVDLPADPTRPVPIQCSACRLPGATGGTGGECASDVDCTAGDNGRCTYGRIGTFCNYDTCFKDEDCGADEVCLCDGSLAGTGGGNACISADCHVDADCGAFACSPTLGGCGHYSNFVAYRCHRATDTCTIDAECGVGGYCAFDEVLGHWQCSTAECAG